MNRAHCTYTIFQNVYLMHIISHKLRHAITADFCTCHDSTAVMACAKICSHNSLLSFGRDLIENSIKFELWMKNPEWDGLSAHYDDIPWEHIFYYWLSALRIYQTEPIHLTENWELSWYQLRILTTFAISVQKNDIKCKYKDYFQHPPSQWEMMLQCNVVSHWLGAYGKWSLKYIFIFLPNNLAC